MREEVSCAFYRSPGKGVYCYHIVFSMTRPPIESTTSHTRRERFTTELSRRFVLLYEKGNSGYNHTVFFRFFVFDVNSNDALNIYY